MPLTHFNRRIAEKTTDRTAAPVLIVALGDSVTQGIGGVDEFYHDCVYHALLKRKLERVYPLCTFCVINGGVDGTRVQDGLARLDRDVIAHRPDLVIVGFGLNDADIGGLDNIEAFCDAFRAIHRRVKQETQADLIFLTPNMMLTRDNDAIPGMWRHVTERFIAVQRGGVLAKYAEAIARLGQELSVPVADVYGRWVSMAGSGVDTTAMLSNGLNHPNPQGHQLIADAIAQVAGIDP